VTVLFADVTGSTVLGERLDAETLRRVIGRYFEAMRSVLERHGGIVEKFVGDAVMAVFGIPVVHEDDALRAVRAALGMQEALAALNVDLAGDWGVRLSARIGVDTGEVVAGDLSAGGTFATGAAVVVAARLEQSAAPDEVLIGRETYLVVRDAVEAEPVEPLALKGKHELVAAYRVVRVLPEPVPARHLDAPLVGRAAELAQLEDAFERAVAERSCRLVTVLGGPGVGKSRLAAEVASRAGDRATVLVGRCLPYGEGITYWPVVEAVKQAAAIADGDPPEQVRAKVASVLGAGEEAPLVAEHVAQVIGVGETTASSGETFWAVRRLLEAIARERPLVLVLEDVHWAEPTLLDLIEYVADWWRDAPLLLLCLARPELLDARPGLGHGRRGGATVRLEPLGEDETDLLIDMRLRGLELGEPARARIKDAAEGNPLFVEQMLAMIGKAGADADDVAVPPTIQAVLAARLDRLGAEERRVLERASVMGRLFWWEAVRELSPEQVRPRLSECLMGLVRKELIVPERGISSRDHGFRFRHILIRDAAYAAIPKEARSGLHERFAAWLEERPGEYEEIIGYHLEQAFRYREQLGPVDERGRELSARAAVRLAAAGRRALARGDMPAAAKLLDRAASLFAAEAAERLELLPDLGRALTEIGSLARAEDVLTEAVRAAESAGELRLRSTALINRAALRLYTRPDVERGAHELAQAAEDAVRVFEEHGDDLGLARAWSKLAVVHWTRCRYAAMEEALVIAHEHAERAGDDQERATALEHLARAALLGPTPVEDGIGRCRTILEQARGNRRLEAVTGVMIAGLEAMRGGLDAARELYAASRACFEELGLERWLAAFSQWSGPAELLAGEPARAEAELREGYESLRAMGDRGLISPVAAFLAQALYAQGRHAEADEFAGISEECASSDDLFPHVVWRGVRAKVLARDGEGDAAARLARDGLAFAEETDSLNLRGDAWADLGEVLRLGGDETGAARCLERALEAYEAKGNVVSAANARTLIAAVGERA